MAKKLTVFVIAAIHSLFRGSDSKKKMKEEKQKKNDYACDVQ